MPVNSVGKLVVEPAVRLPAKLAIRLSVELAVSFAGLVQDEMRLGIQRPGS
jgi:hypothetical protein